MLPSVLNCNFLKCKPCKLINFVPLMKKHLDLMTLQLLEKNNLTRQYCLSVSKRNFPREKSSNKLRMKALVGWNTFSKVPELINLKVFFTRMKNDKDKEDKILLWNFWNVKYLPGLTCDPNWLKWDLKLSYMVPKLTYLGLKLSYMGSKLTYMGLELTYMGLKLTYMGHNLSSMGL